MILLGGRHVRCGRNMLRPRACGPALFRPLSCRWTRSRTKPSWRGIKQIHAKFFFFQQLLIYNIKAQYTSLEKEFSNYKAQTSKSYCWSASVDIDDASVGGVGPIGAKGPTRSGHNRNIKGHRSRTPIARSTVDIPLIGLCLVMSRR